MLVYTATKEIFFNDVLSNDFENIILNKVRNELKKSVWESERRSRADTWNTMYKILADDEIPNDAKISIEFQIPRTSKRIDFIVTGQNSEQQEQAIIIELKQRDKAELTDKDGVVITRFKNGAAETSHPSYQAWSYVALLEWFNETVYEENIKLYPCAYLHNYQDDWIISHEFYNDYIKKSPLFLKADAIKLRQFIKQYIKYGDKKDIMYRINCGKIKPSKALADSMVSMLKWNQEFIMIDDQKVVFENAISLAKHSDSLNKNILIVEWGPWTGKSVVAVNLLVQVTKLWMIAQYVTKNSAPRDVYNSKLTGTFKKTEISNLFTGSGQFINTEKNTFDALIVDEAHRLNAKSWMFKNLGENQIKEIIEATKLSVFFIDEDQKVTLSDIGTKQEIIERWNKLNAKISILNLSSQFRCNGSDGYLAWLDNTLQIKDTANEILDTNDYDFQIVESPNKLRDIIFEKNKINNKARIVAGYCWKWTSKKNSQLYDIEIPEHDFKMRWNLWVDGNLRILKPLAVSEAGCIHTCQWLEVDYIWVIVWDDLVVRNGKVVTNHKNRASTDQSLKWLKKLIERNPEFGYEEADKIIKNTYRTLMTRGMKWCYVYFVDKETEEWFKGKIRK